MASDPDQSRQNAVDGFGIRMNKNDLDPRHCCIRYGTGTGLQISRKIYFAQIYFMNAVCVKLARMFLLFIQIVEIPALSAVGTF